MEQITVEDKDYYELFQSCLKILDSKGKDYTIGSDDKLHNFRTVAEFTGLTMEQVFGVYFYKHISALFAYIKNGGQHESEPIKGRIVDIINYAMLFYKIVNEHTGVSKSDHVIDLSKLLPGFDPSKVVWPKEIPDLGPYIPDIPNIPIGPFPNIHPIFYRDNHNVVQTTTGEIK